MQIAQSPDLAKNPQSYYCDKNGNRGITGIVILETSNCAVHTWTEDAPAKFEFDLYSCADFNPMEVLDLIDIFGIIRYNSILINREHGLEILETYQPSFKEITNDTTPSPTEEARSSSIIKAVA